MYRVFLYNVVSSSTFSQTEAASGRVLDLVLIMDFTTYSLHTTTEMVAAVKTFANALLQELAMHIGVKTTHVGVIKYGRVATTVVQLTDSYDVTAIQNTISSTGIDHALRWGSNVGVAIRQAVTEFTHRGRPVSTTARKAVLISTYPPSDTAQHRKGQVDHAKSSNVTLYAVGIGTFVDAITLRRITHNDSTRVYLAASVNTSLDLIEDLASALLPGTMCECRGEKGDRGVKGDQGPVGPPGTPGHRGAKGEKGEDGLDGEKGEQGVIGPRGPSGLKGSRGAAGGVGPKGQKGERGSTGATGYGQKGQKGVGQKGQKGERGYRGATGYGQKGQKGQYGNKGSKGDRGYQGPPGPNEGGSVYTCWGRKSCPGVYGTETVYKGHAAGTRYSSRGGGANMLCLPENPTYATYYSGVNGDSTLGAVEYEGFTQLKGVRNENAACAVCTTTRIRHLMIPGTPNCPSGWTREYWGYLVGGKNNYHRAEFVCFHYSLQSVPGSAGDHQSSAEIYTVEVNCDVLPCPPYSSTKELTCVVCTK